MSNLRYLVIGTLAVLMPISACQCQCGRSRPPGVEDAPQSSGFKESKPPVLSDAVKPTPAQRPEPKEDDEVAETPPELPKDFPKDIPVVADAEVAQVQDLANDARNVIFITAKPVTEITTFYRKKMEDAGWKLTQESERSEHAFVSFKRGNMIANLQVAEDPRYPGKRIIAIMYEEEKELPFPEF